MSLDKESYAIGLHNASGSTDILLKSVTFIENGNYSAPPGTAYRSVRVAVSTEVPEGTLEIEENGLYDVSTYEKANVNVHSAGDPYEKLNEYLDLSIRYFKSDLCKKFMVRSHGDAVLSKLEFYSAKAIEATTFDGLFYNCGKLKYANLGFCTRITANVGNNARMLRTIILRRNTAPATLENTANALADTPIGKGAVNAFVYVPDYDVNGEDLVAKYKIMTNWVRYADNITGYSSAPEYDSSTEYSIGDVCKYAGRLYGYCNEDLTSSTGNAPSGISEDNAYWEYVDDIPVA